MCVCVHVDNGSQCVFDDSETQSVAREAQSLTRQGPVYKGTFVFPWNLNKIILAFNLQIIFTTYIIVMMQLIHISQLYDS